MTLRVKVWNFNNTNNEHKCNFSKNKFAIFQFKTIRMHLTFHNQFPHKIRQWYISCNMKCCNNSVVVFFTQQLQSEYVLLLLQPTLQLPIKSLIPLCTILTYELNSFKMMTKVSYYHVHATDLNNCLADWCASSSLQMCRSLYISIKILSVGIKRSIIFELTLREKFIYSVKTMSS